MMNIQEQKDYNKQYYQNNKNKLLDRQKQYYINNTNNIKSYILSWANQNKEKRKSYNSKYYKSFATPSLSAGIVPIEEVRKVDELLQVKCTYCGKWFNPTILMIRCRITGLIGKGSECRFYCSDSCKKSCPIYHKQKYPEGTRKNNTREVQPELRKMVFKRDNYTCQKCGSQDSLECHHVEGIRWEPLESADVDKCITYCETCHDEAHTKEGCMYFDMQCKEFNFFDKNI